jgi:MSHA biogenesis protein MshL
MDFKIILCVFLSFCLVSCDTIHATHPRTIDQIQDTMDATIQNDKALEAPHIKKLPANVDSALLPPLSHYVNPAQDTQPRFDVAANNLPARDFFMGLVAGTTTNMVVHPNLTGAVTLNLKNVTIKQALDAARDIYGYEYQETSYGYEILAPQLETKIFHINYLDVQRSGKSYIELTTGEVSSVGTISVNGSSGSSGSPTTPGTTGQSNPATISSIETTSQIKFWKDMEKAILSITSAGNNRSVTVNALTGVIVVRAYPSELHNVENFIDRLQSSLNRQVILEAKILEVKLDDQYQAGIDWSILANPTSINPSTGLPETAAGIGQGGTSAFEETNLKTLNGIFAIRLNGNFKTLIELLETQGNVQVLSSPHISTVNNQKAVIKVGQDEFFVTGVSTTNTIVGNNTLPSQNVSLTPFFSGITLDVTPEISSNNEVILHIHPSVSVVKEQTKSIQLGAGPTGTPNELVLPLAASTIRESDNIVRAKNGQVVVIGGLMQNNMQEVVAGTPGISKIPFIGALFRRTQQISSKSELVILLRPIVATNQAMIKSLETEKKSFQSLKRPFHAGGLPKIFGNEGERADSE